MVVISLLTLSIYVVIFWKLRWLRRVPTLPKVVEAPSQSGRVTVVTAAGNETEAIVSCLRSVLADAKVRLVVVVDAHSRDTTLHLAKNVAATDNRLLVLSAPDLPSGWVGKSHALHYGAQNMGGHERFKRAVVDDVFLARTAKEHGARTTFLDLSGVVRVWLFEGMLGYFRAIARSTQAYLGNKALALVGGAVAVTFGFCTALNIVASQSIVLANIPTVDGWQGTFAAVATLGYGFAMCCAWKIRRYHDGAFFWSLLFPIAVVVMGPQRSIAARRSLRVVASAGAAGITK